MKPHSNDQQFPTSVRKHFDFLKSSYDFRDHPKALGYIRDALEIEFFHGKGEVDILFFVRRDDEIFKPFVSRLFDLTDIVRRLKPEKIEFPGHLPEFLTEAGDVDDYLEFCATLTKSYCKPILQGDLSVFEEIHLRRRENA